MNIKNLKINKRILSFILAFGFMLFPNVSKGETSNNRYQIVSIFNDENINSGQYGASQIAFKENVRQLLADELIWDEL